MATEERQQRGITDGLDLGPIEEWADTEAFKSSKFFAEYLNRLVAGRDMHIIVTASAETGVGKTTLAASLAIMLDQHGWSHEKAAVASAEQYSHLYDEVPPGSVLILDEAEKAADARRGMTKESVEISQAFATKRYQQVFGILTAPSRGWVDDRLGADAADYWIQAEQTDLGRVKGVASVYRMKNNEHYMEEYTDRYEKVHWPHLDWHPEFKKLDRKKTQLLESDHEAPYIHRDEAEDWRDEAYEQGRTDMQQEVIERMSEQGFTQVEIGDAVDLHQTTVSNRLNGG